MKQDVIDIISNQSYRRENGETISFTSAIDIDEAEFISWLIQKYHPVRTIEIGFAEGASSLAILDSLSGWKAEHTIIDPFQSTQWKNIGVNLLNKFGYSNFKLIEKKSEFALPDLLENNEKFDLAFIDGYHTFDHTLLDAFYLTKMLNTGGLLIIDDVQMPAINKCIRYLYNYPCLRYVASSKPGARTSSRKVVDTFKKSVGLVSGLMPSRLRSEVFDGSVLKSDPQLGLTSSMIAFEKVHEDEREWNWWKPF